MNYHLSYYLSYCPEDAGDILERIRKAVSAHHVDSVPPGQDARQVLQDAISTSTAVLAVIGERWGMKAHTAGQRGLDNADDFVRIELETALARGIPVFVILAGSATLPAPDEMPPGLEALGACQAVPVRAGEHCATDLQLLSRLLLKNKLLHDRPLETTRRKYFCYASRARLHHLYEKSGLDGTRPSHPPQPQAGPLMAPLSSPMRFGLSDDALGEVKPEAVAGKLSAVLGWIGKQQKVVDLKRLLQEKQGLDPGAFCYTYGGWFRCLGWLDREAHSSLNNVRAAAVGDLAKEPSEAQREPEIFIPEELLRAQARQENAYREIGPNRGPLVSGICVLSSKIPPFTLRIACPFRFFSEMGGQWDERKSEWDVRPHSGNRHFFGGYTATGMESVLFIHGMSGHTLWGSPLCLARQTDPALML
jgi:hypothetical protein